MAYPGKTARAGKGAMRIASLANGIVDPVLAKRAGISTALIASWAEIVGADFADCTRPEKIAWPRRDFHGEEGHRPGVLTIACEGARALFLTHASSELIARVNSFFGYPAIERIRIVQKPVDIGPPRRRALPPLSGEAALRLEQMMEGIESEALRRAVERLGRAVLQERGTRGAPMRRF